METQETIIHRLVMRNPDFDAFMKNPNFGKEKGHGRHTGVKRSGPHDPNRMWAHWVEFLGQPLSQTFFQNFRA